MFTRRPIGRTAYSQTGISLIELIMFIVILGVGLAGILSVMNLTTSHSADPMIRKQVLSIAEALLEEVELQPFTYCDPDDANATTAASTAGCAAPPQGISPTPATETRYGSEQFDNVGDYGGFSMTGIRDITNTALTGLGAYTASVAITQDGAAFTLAAGEVLRIDVTAQSGAEVITLTGYRFRYAPNAVP